ncbi:hypothetical protein [Clostridioides sp. ES-S-0048-02]|uniref:hypothetical protein n=1 Tax=Clostridioides sp. ES-S-0048-02 TaxID=2770777 RepID=UPI001D105398|nr:hypothetical protein [Clostridioides sp. ES-S-0048-02]
MTSIDYESIGKRAFEWCLNSLKSTYKTFTDTDLDIDIKYWVNNDISIGGRSSFDGKNYLLSINKGVFKEIDSIFYTLLESELEENQKTREDFYQKVSFEFGDYDRQRAKIYSEILITLSIDIIIFHELGHIMDGHLGYLNELKSGCTAYLNNSVSNDVDNLVNQILEMDADSFAATRIIDAIIYDKNIDNYNKTHENIIKSKNHAFWLATVAATVVFSLQGMGRSRAEKELKLAYYLPLRTRHHHFINCLIASHNAIEVKERLKFTEDFLMEVIPNIEEFINLYFRGTFDFDEIDANLNNNLHELDKSYIDHYHELNRIWTRDIRDKLVQYSYFELAD